MIDTMNTLMMLNAMNTITPFDAKATASSILSILVTVGGIAVACFLIWNIVKGALGFAKGEGSTSIWKILGEVLFLILCIGLIFMAQNWEALGNKAKNIGNKGLEAVDGTLNDAIK